MTLPTIDDFAASISLPQDTTPAERLDIVMSAIIQLARQDRYDPEPELAFIGFKVAAVLALHCLANFNQDEANDLADRIWDSVQQEHHA